MSETLSALISKDRQRGHPALYIGLAGDAPRTPPARVSLRGIDRVDIGRGDARRIERTHDKASDVLVVALTDGRMSTKHARLTRVGASWILEDLQSKNGTWIDGQPATRRTLTDGTAFIVGHTAFVFRDHGGEAPDQLGAPGALADGLATLSPELSTRYAELASAAKSNVPIEITGGTGTGKELVARAVHTLSGRRGAFVAVNCGALSGTLLEGELFGHRRGAYTGASDERAGLVRSADGGTLFLDEIAELPASSQAALLRVLQEGEVTPLGADRAVKVDVRVVAATHKNLDAEVAANRFRADLRARLLGFQLALPDLRDRREDLALLVATLLERHAPGRSVGFYADVVAALYAYDWPLNVRELERTLAAALAVAADHIEMRHLPGGLRGERVAELPVDVSALSAADREIREKLVTSLAQHDGNIAAVARALGKDRTQIRRWMKRFGLSRDED